MGMTKTKNHHWSSITNIQKEQASFQRLFPSYLDFIRIQLSFELPFWLTLKSQFYLFCSIIKEGVAVDVCMIFLKKSAFLHLCHFEKDTRIAGGGGHFVLQVKKISSFQPKPPWDQRINGRENIHTTLFHYSLLAQVTQSIFATHYALCSRFTTEIPQGHFYRHVFPAGTAQWIIDYSRGFCQRSSTYWLHCKENPLYPCSNQQAELLIKLFPIHLSGHTAKTTVNPGGKLCGVKTTFICLFIVTGKPSKLLCDHF